MTSKNYKEIDFETHIEEHLLASNYRKGNPLEYDKTLCLIPDEVITFVKNSQPKEWEKLESQYGDDVEAKFLHTLSQKINKKGTLLVFRKGIKDRGARIQLSYFKPTSGMNKEHWELYQKNRFTVTRQVKYSLKNENSLDMVIFLNGLPIITMELKNSLTGQTVEHAVRQYKYDRDQKEPLFVFKRCLVHFAVGNEKVFMTTRLRGKKTNFLPFNRDTENPINPNGHKTSYLWEDIFQQDTLLDIIGNYLLLQEKENKVYRKGKGLTVEKWFNFIFPRFHQLDCVRKLIDGVKKEGVGNNYLIQHSAGSGKSNSIAWLAHKLSSLYQHKDDKDRMFDSIIVITDRRILDAQLQKTIKQFEQTTGVVNPIDMNSKQLKEALQHGKDIIISTIQKFPVIAEEIVNLKGKNFAVIVDEAHSSQSGENAAKLQEVLSGNQEDESEFNIEDIINKELEFRGKQKHISYFAFTATPKGKTLEMFGRKNSEGKFLAYHIYSMRQAIQENFILDVLKNYTTFKRYFKLVKSVEDDDEYERKKAVRVLTNYVDLTDEAIGTKVNIILDHFLDSTVNKITGKARAMIVTRSRLHAVKTFLTLRNCMKERNLSFGALVAFSGTVTVPQTGIDYTENSLNNLAPKVSIQDAFYLPEYRIMVVANKFQTGFDFPLLHTMYVDKKLSGVTAVQTLSRLNRVMTGKTDTFVLDFVNDTETIQKSFQDYYQTTVLEEETEPNKLYNIQDELEEFDIYDKSDVSEFAKIFFNPKKKAELLQPVLDRVVHIWKNREEDERESFRSILQSFIRLYGFISQIITFKDTELHSLYVFSRALNRKLPKTRNPLPYEILDEVDLASLRIQETYHGNIELEKKDGATPGISSNSKSSVSEDEKELLSNIIKALNEIHGVEITEENRQDLQTLHDRIREREDLQEVLQGNNTKENKKYKFEKVFDALVLDYIHNKLDFYKKMTIPKVNTWLKSQWFDQISKRGL